MSLRVPFFGLIAPHSPMEGLGEHYMKILEGVHLIEEALECYIGGGPTCGEFVEITEKIETLEEQADKIKRKIRNHLPRSLFMPVDKVLFFNYTRSQDNILDDAHDAMQWLFMRPANFPKEIASQLLNYVPEVIKSVRLLQAALDSTVNLIIGKHYNRSTTKETFRAVRAQHKKVYKQRTLLLQQIYNADLNFKDVYQLLHFVDKLSSMSHNAEDCVDLLRAMIAR